MVERREQRQGEDQLVAGARRRGAVRLGGDCPQQVQHPHQVLHLGVGAVRPGEVMREQFLGLARCGGIVRSGSAVPGPQN